jgi:hypothetical protein
VIPISSRIRRFFSDKFPLGFCPSATRVWFAFAASCGQVFGILPERKGIYTVETLDALHRVGELGDGLIRPDIMKDFETVCGNKCIITCACNGIDMPGLVDTLDQAVLRRGDACCALAGGSDGLDGRHGVCLGGAIAIVAP